MLAIANERDQSCTGEVSDLTETVCAVLANYREDGHLAPVAALRAVPRRLAINVWQKGVKSLWT
jgi:hypothetical protein